MLYSPEWGEPKDEGEKRMKDTLYVVGHRNPDTDSIASAIAYAELKRRLGHEAVPCRLAWGSGHEDTAGFNRRFHMKDGRVITVRSYQRKK